MSNSIIMVPVKGVKADLVTETDYTIYIPLSSRENFGAVKVGDGLDISEGLISLSADILADLASGSLHAKGLLPYDSEFKYKQYAICYYNKNLYVSLIADNIGNPLTDTTSWEKVVLEDVKALQDDVAGLTTLVNSFDGIITANTNKIAGVELSTKGIKLEEDALNPGKLKFTNYNGETNSVQGGFLPDDDTVELDANNKLTAKAIKDSLGTLTPTDILEAIDDVAEKAEGKSTSYAISATTNPDFNSINDTLTLTASSTMTDTNGTQITLSDLKIGDNVYITENNIPDRWVSGKTSSNITFNKLETVPKVDSVNGKTGVVVLNANDVGAVTSNVTDSAVFEPTRTIITNKGKTTDFVIQQEKTAGTEVVKFIVEKSLHSGSGVNFKTTYANPISPESNRRLENNGYSIAYTDDLKMIADEYTLTTYSIGDIVINNQKLYKCNTAITTAEIWDSTHWTETTVDELIAEKQNIIDASHKLSADLVDDANTTNKFVTATEKSTWNGKANKSIVADEYSSSQTYSVGDVVIYNDVLYKCTTAVTTAESFDSNKWTSQTVEDLISAKQNILTAGNNITIVGDTISASGGEVTEEDVLSKLPNFVHSVTVTTGYNTSNTTYVFPIVSSSNIYVKWGDGTGTYYTSATTSMSHKYTATDYTKFQIKIFGDWKGFNYTSSYSSYNSYNIIKEVVYDGNITSIPNYAFSHTSLKRIKFNENVSNIGNYAFESTSLIEIEIPNPSTTVGTNAFQYCHQLKTIKLYMSPSNINNTYGNYCFAYCSGLVHLELPRNVYMGSYALSNLSSLKTLKITAPYAVSYFATSSNTLNNLPSNAVILVPYSYLSDYKSMTNITAYANQIYPIGGQYSETVTITSGSWSNNSVTATVVGATNESRNVLEWTLVDANGVQIEDTYGLKATAQGNKTITFSCTTTPTTDIKIFVKSTLTNYGE